MFKANILIFAIFVLLQNIGLAEARYGETYCNQTGFHCIKVKKNQNWNTLFPNPEQQMLIKKLNRINIRLYPGMKLAVPDSLLHASIETISPFPLEVYEYRNHVIVDQSQLAWVAYDANGRLANWGPMSGGKDYCADIDSGCKTATGRFTIYREQGAGCVSSRFPVGKGGAPMPWCMHFHRGFALHGSYSVPGYHASHGCVRLLVEDARWLNQEFVKIGTPVIVLPKY